MWSEINPKHLLFFLIFATGPGLVSNLQAQDLTQDQIQQDFEFLNNALAEGHPGLYWFSSKQELDKTIKKVEDGLDEVSNVKELQSLFTDINNAISCGHTAILELHAIERIRSSAVGRSIPAVYISTFSYLGHIGSGLGLFVNRGHPYFTYSSIFRHLNASLSLLGGHTPLT